MKILTQWLRSYLPGLSATDRQLAENLTLRGIAVEGVFPLEDGGSLFEMDITTNRVDAMNHYGVAREAAAVYGLDLPALNATLPAAKPGAGYPVRNEAPGLCGRFTARVLRGVRIGPSSGLVAERFGALGQKQISNAVDATNYITLAMGHPTHAFDMDKLEGAIVIRRARKGEKLRTLDGVERTLDTDDVVIADVRKALGLAGVMGGWDTMITPETRNILVEAAWFDPVTVRRMSRRHALHSDASHRFERGADFNAPPLASALVAQLILESGGEPEGELVDVVAPEAAARTAHRPPIALAVSEARRILGATEDGAGVTEAITTEVLAALGCSLQPRDGSGEPQGGPGRYAVTLPSWRLDLEREIDLIEEIARVYGYNRFANTLPAFSGTVIELPHANRHNAVRRLMLAAGFHEAISSTFCSAEEAALFAPQPGNAIAMGNPLNEEAGMLRPSLLPGMLTLLGNNLNRNVEDVRLFETGTIFSGTGDRVEERPALSLGATGAFSMNGSHQPPRPVDFYDVKGVVEALLDRFATRSAYFDTFPAEQHLLPAWLHPGRAARCVADGATVGYFGQLHPQEADRRKFRQPVFVGEISLDRLYRLNLKEPHVRELSRFQPVRRDFSLIFPDAVRWESIEQALRGLGIEELTGYRPAEIFRDRKGQTVPAGHYSVLVSVMFQAPERTMREEELQGWSRAIVEALHRLGGTLRSEAAAIHGSAAH